MNLATGSIVDRKYEVLALLGEGGMGAVLRARHVLTEQIVALKVLDVTTGDEGKARRFKLEVSVAAKVKHPALVKVFDAGVEPEKGRYYLAMELLEGRSLRDVMEDASEPAHVCVGYVRDALDAMVAAHAAGVVHRDLKPDNLFVERTEDGDERLRVLDFGIARDIQEASRTTTGVAVGTALYMSPEQATADKGTGPSADIWACGAMLYQILTGQLPFDGASAHAVVVDAVTRPHRPVGALRPDLAPGWSELVDACLAKKPAERPTAEELRDALTTLLAEDRPADVSAPVPLVREASQGAASDAELAATEAAPSAIETSVQPELPAKRGPLLVGLGVAAAALIGLAAWATSGSTSPPRPDAPVADSPPPAPAPEPEVVAEVDGEPEPEPAEPAPNPAPVVAEPLHAVRTVAYDTTPERPAPPRPRPEPAEPEPVEAAAADPTPDPDPAPDPAPAPAPDPHPHPTPADPAPGHQVLQGTDAFDRQARRRRP